MRVSICGRRENTVPHKYATRALPRCSDDMMILKGVNIFPIQIEKILLQFKELSTDYLITLETVENGDIMTVDVEINQMFTDDYRRLQSLEKEITRQLKDEILNSKLYVFVDFQQMAQSGTPNEWMFKLIASMVDSYSLSLTEAEKMEITVRTPNKEENVLRTIIGGLAQSVRMLM